MKYAIVIDSVATLPEYVIEQRPIKILPVTITIDDTPQADTYVAEELGRIYQSGIINTNSKIDTIPPVEREIHDFILDEVHFFLGLRCLHEKKESMNQLVRY